MSSERFGISLDIANPEDPTQKTRAEIDITGKRSPWAGAISAPTPSTPLKTLTDELGTLSGDESGLGRDTDMTDTGYQ